MKTKLIFVFIALLVFLPLLGCGGGGNEEFSFIEPTPHYDEETTKRYLATVLKNGTFVIPQNYSNLRIEAQENSTLKENSEINLIEREPKADELIAFAEIEKKLSFSNAVTSVRGATVSPTSTVSKVYILSAKTGDNSETVGRLEKPITVTFINNFESRFNDFYFICRKSGKDYCLTKFVDYNDVSANVGKDVCIAVKELNEFKIRLYDIDIEFAILAVENKGTTNAIKQMYSSARLKMEGDKATGIIISTGLVANNTWSFANPTVKDEVIIFSSENIYSKLEKFKINGAAPKLSEESLSGPEKEIRYVYTIDSFSNKDIEVSGNMATYSFVINFEKMSLSDFPAYFSVKTTFTDVNGISFVSENKLNRPSEEKKPDPVVLPLITLSATPVAGENTVATQTPVVITFSESINWTEKDKDLVCIKTGETICDCDYQYDAKAKTLTLTSLLPFDYNTVYSINVLEGLHGKEEPAQMVASLTQKFRTKKEAKPLSMIWVALKPFEDKFNVATITPVVLEFAKSIDWTDKNKDLVSISTENEICGCNYKYDDKALTLTLTASKPFDYDTVYTVKVKDGLFGKDEPKQKVASLTRSFKTMSEPKIEPEPLPLINVSMVPFSDSKNVATVTQIILTFSESINWFTDAQSYVFIKAGSTIWGSSYKYDDTARTLTLTPSVPFSYGTDYSVNVTEGLFGKAQPTQQVASFTQNFRTMPAPDPLAPINVSMVSPANGSSGVATDTEIVLSCSDAISWNSSDDRFVVIHDSRSVVFGSYSYNRDSKTITFVPNEPLSFETDYSVEVLEGLTGVSREQKVLSTVFSFRTMSAIAVSAEIAIAENSLLAGKALESPTLEINFNKPVRSTSEAVRAISLTANGSPVELYANWKNDRTGVSLTPAVALPVNADCVVSMTDTVVDNEDCVITPFENFNFTVLPFSGNGSLGSPFMINNSIIKPSEDYKLPLDGSVYVDTTAIEANMAGILFNNSAVIASGSAASYRLSCDSSYDSVNKRLSADLPTDFYWPVDSNIRLMVEFSGNLDDRTLYFKTDSKIYPTKTFSGLGTSDKPYLIFTAYQLDRARDFLSSSFKIMADINISPDSYSSRNYNSGEGWLPIGNETAPFTGEMDGNGKTISGLSIYRPTENYVGLFGSIKDASIANIIIATGSTVIGNKYVGAIAGYAVADAKSVSINSCQNSANIEGTESGSYQGGIVGSVVAAANSLLIADCSNYGSVDSVGSFAAGIVGYAEAKNSALTVKNSINNGSVNASKGWIGGILGVGKTVSGSLDITGCENNASITSATTYSGGILGVTSGAAGTNVTDCKNTAAVTAATGNAGGICCVGSDSCDISSCENSGTITGNAKYTGGICAYTVGEISECKNSGEVNGTTYTGGIVGDADSIINCENSGPINVSSSYCGGIAASAGEVNGCKNTGSVTSSSTYAGGVIGTADIVRNCLNAGTVTGTSYVGGVCSTDSTPDGIVEMCTNTGAVTANTQYAGGVIAFLKTKTSISYCKNTGDVTSPKFAGGVVGISGTSAVNATTYALTRTAVGGMIHSCINIGKITATTCYAGGIAAKQSGNITDCYNCGEISGGAHPDTGLGGVGGICGVTASTTALISNCYVDNCNVIGDSRSTGSIVGQNYGTSNTINIQNCFVTDSATVNGGTVSSTTVFNGLNQGTCNIDTTCYILGTGSSSEISAKSWTSDSTWNNSSIWILSSSAPPDLSICGSSLE